MAKLYAILLLLAICTCGLAQQKAVGKIDSVTRLQPRVDSLVQKARLAKADSMEVTWQNKIDSIKSVGNLNRYRDSLKVLGWADSVRTAVASNFAKKQNALLSSSLGHPPSVLDTE